MKRVRGPVPLLDVTGPTDTKGVTTGVYPPNLGQQFDALFAEIFKCKKSSNASSTGLIDSKTSLKKGAHSAT